MNMPMPGLENGSPKGESSPSSPESDVPKGASAQNGGLPEIIDPAKEGDSEVNVPLIPKEGIKVVALRKGFFGQLRLKEGDEFVVKKMENLGEWMKCLDPSIQKKHKELIKKKKKGEL